jgi:hypothetical protein
MESTLQHLMLLLIFFNICLPELLSELTKREKQAGIYPEPEVDFFMRVSNFCDL